MKSLWVLGLLLVAVWQPRTVQANGCAGCLPGSSLPACSGCGGSSGNVFPEASMYQAGSYGPQIQYQVQAMNSGGGSGGGGCGCSGMASCGCMPSMVIEKAHVIGVSMPVNSMEGGTIVSRTYKPGPPARQIYVPPAPIHPRIIRKRVMVKVPIEVERVVVPPQQPVRQIIQEEPTWNYRYAEKHIVEGPRTNMEYIPIKGCCGQATCCNGGCCSGR